MDVQEVHTLLGRFVIMTNQRSLKSPFRFTDPNRKHTAHMTMKVKHLAVLSEKVLIKMSNNGSEFYSQMYSK